MQEKEMIAEALQAQKDYCKREKDPFFIPEDGVCWSCHKNIFGGPKAITAEKAGSALITSCPYCSSSFVD